MGDAEETNGFRGRRCWGCGRVLRSSMARLEGGVRPKPFPESENQEVLVADFGSVRLVGGVTARGGKATQLPSSTAPSRMII